MPAQEMTGGGRVVVRLRVLCLAAVLAGCSLLETRTFHATYPARPEMGQGPLPVAFADTTGQVVGVEIVPEGPSPDAEVLEVPGDPRAVMISWTGGVCDERVDLRLEVRQRSIGIVGTTQRAAECPALTIERALILRFYAAVGSSTVPGDGRLTCVLRSFASPPATSG
jgi:hypothetical protein